ncbi:MAG TPA: rhodanese-like domain-containing protein [Acidiferrobacterales bacterium]|nr:rhodanese-like domain-containing protein [Acidiferrobacterales bacterium]
MQQITVQQLQQKLEAPGAKPVLLDVREPWEFQICSIAGSTHIPMGQIPARLKELNKDNEIVAICHVGGRSQQVAGFLENQGFKKLYNLQGGVDAWAREIDPKMNKY